MGCNCGEEPSVSIFGCRDLSLSVGNFNHWHWIDRVVVRIFARHNTENIVDITCVPADLDKAILLASKNNWAVRNYLVAFS